MKKVLLMILVITMISLGAGFTSLIKWVDASGSFSLLEYDEGGGGNELIGLQNSDGLSQFGKWVTADVGWLSKGEYTNLTGSNLLKFEEVEWGVSGDSSVYINKWTQTADLEQQQFVVATGWGSDTMQISSNNTIYELGQVMLWDPMLAEAPRLVPAWKEPIPKPPLPPIPDP